MVTARSQVGRRSPWSWNRLTDHVFFWTLRSRSTALTTEHCSCCQW